MQFSSPQGGKSKDLGEMSKKIVIQVFILSQSN